MATARIPLIGNPTSRGSNINQDQRFVNCFPEVVTDPVSDTKKTYVRARAGFNFADGQDMTTYTEPRGFISWNNSLYYVVDNKVIKGTITPPILFVTYTEIGTITTSTGRVGFVAWKAANDYLILVDGTKGYYITTSDVITEITDVDFPTPHLPYPVVLDQYLFIQKTNGEIYNCNVGDVTAWSATSYLTPESYPDGAVGIARQNNLLVALGTNSVEFFYDAANPTPGSPLGKYQQSILQYGCASMKSVATEEGNLFFIARSETGEKFVVKVDGTKDSIVSSEAINRVITNEKKVSTGGTLIEITNAYGFLCRQGGHLFYVVQLPYQSRSLVYDVGTSYWHEWEAQLGSSEITTMLPVQASTECYNTPYYLSSDLTYCLTSLSVDDYYYDFTTGPILVQVQTVRHDFDSAKMKFLHRVELLCDSIGGSLSAPISLSWSDDDYLSWSTPRECTENTRFNWYRLGSFRRRAFRIYYNLSATPIKRLSTIECEIDIGVH